VAAGEVMTRPSVSNITHLIAIETPAARVDKLHTTKVYWCDSDGWSVLADRVGSAFGEDAKGEDRPTADLGAMVGKPPLGEAHCCAQALAIARGVTRGAYVNFRPACSEQGAVSSYGTAKTPA
jgi:hypothetical protein